MKTLTRRQINERKNKIMRKRASGLKGKQPERNAKYLAFIKNLGCSVCTLTCFGCANGAPHWVTGTMYGSCSQESPTQACHMGPHGISQKASDYTCVPLCARHHEEIGSSIKKLEALGIDYSALVEKLRLAYEAQR